MYQFNFSNHDVVFLQSNIKTSILAVSEIEKFTTDIAILKGTTSSYNVGNNVYVLPLMLKVTLPISDYLKGCGS